MKLFLANTVFISALVCPLSSVSAADKSLASTLNIYVFPTAGQDSSRQSSDEASCYQWAVNNSGVDPFDVERNAAAQAQQSNEAQQRAEKEGAGAGAKGALRGALGGALIGEIADDDAGGGAAIGAVIGTVRGRRKGREARSQAQRNVQQQEQMQQQVTAQQRDDFKRAFSVCLEAKDYLVK